MSQPESGGENARLLMVVKTYPTPSAKHGELVCTAGVDLDSGEWKRVYPFPFRTAAHAHQFRKYEVVSIRIRKAGGEDTRPDSYRLVDLDSVERLEVIGTDSGTWSTRLRYLLPTALETVQSFQDRMLPEDDGGWGQSIGLVRARSGSGRLLANPRSGGWTDQELTKLGKARDSVMSRMFVPTDVSEFKDLMRIPYDFRLGFQDMSGADYEFPILDWEIAALYLKSRRHSDAKALEDVREKIENQIFDESRDVWLVLGSLHQRFKRRNLLAVDGFVWPKASQQHRLF